MNVFDQQYHFVPSCSSYSSNCVSFALVEFCLNSLISSKGGVRGGGAKNNGELRMKHLIFTTSPHSKLGCTKMNSFHVLPDSASKVDCRMLKRVTGEAWSSRKHLPGVYPLLSAAPSGEFRGSRTLGGWSLVSCPWVALSLDLLGLGDEREWKHEWGNDNKW